MARNCRKDRSKALAGSWDKNAGNWARAVRDGLIPSRRAGTDEAIVNAILAHKPARLLDVGCGEGWLIRRVAQSIDCQALSIDGSAALIADARQADPRHAYRVFAYADLIEDAKSLGTGFDAIVFNYAILDEDAARLLTSVEPLLAPEGRIFIQTLHPRALDGPYRDGWRTEDFAAFAGPGWEPMPWYFRTVESWHETLRDAGLVLLDLTEPMADGRPLSLLMTCKSLKR
ncbi:MAG: class I SAM-dependent methyltransferase [Inquilinus sp.]|nr:class I SAM-dependent methyltransferase [Inquilinus sp.]